MSATMPLAIPVPAPRPPSRDAEVIDLDAERTRRRPTRAVYVRRRLAVLTAALLAVLALALGLGAATADAGPVAPELIGSVVLAPGDTLWDVAVTHAPDGVDARAYLEAIRDVNDLGTTVPAPWTVVLLPAR